MECTFSSVRTIGECPLVTDILLDIVLPLLLPCSEKDLCRGSVGCPPSPEGSVEVIPDTMFPLERILTYCEIVPVVRYMQMQIHVYYTCCWRNWLTKSQFIRRSIPQSLQFFASIYRYLNRCHII